MPETTTAAPAVMLPTAPAPAAPRSDSIRNMRVTFWGVQGSCPIFPTGREVTAYAQRIVHYTIERALSDLTARAERGEIGVDQLRRMSSPEGIARYKEQIGLPDLPVYGGETTCVEVETSEGHILVFDMGSGLREFSSHLLRKWANRRNRVLHLFGSHEHLDHRSGLPFAGFCFAKVEPFTLQVYGTHRFLQALDERYGLFSREIMPTAHADDPLDYRMMAASFLGTEIRRRPTPPVNNGAGRRRRGAAEASSPGAPTAGTAATAPVGGNGMGNVTGLPWRVHDIAEPIRVGQTTITPFEVYHGVTDCLGYKIRHGDVSFVFCTDHELRHGDDPTDPRQAKSAAAEATLVEQCRDADLGYFDGQYFRSEYEGLRGIGLTPPVSRVGWGHGCIEDVIARARKCRVKHALIGHHDPERQWDARLHLDHELAKLCEGDPDRVRLELAKQAQVVDL